MSSNDDERWMIMAVLDHLQKAVSRNEGNAESLQEAMFALSNAYTLNMHSSATKQRYPLNGLSLVDIFKSGRSALLGTSASPSDQPATNSAAKTEAAPAVSPNGATSSGSDKGFERFVSRLKETTAFFKGVAEGTPQYDDRLALARTKYDARLASKKQRVNPTEDTATQPEPAATETRSMPPSAAPAAAETAAPTRRAKEATEESKKRASEVKERGNAQLKAKQYEAALQSYSECIELDGNNAVYYSNRAAAKILLSRFSEAVDDCKVAIGLDSNFVRPRERLASAYRYLGMTEREAETLRGALALDGSNEAFRMQLRDAENKLAREGSSGGGGGGGGGPSHGVDAAMLNNLARSVGLDVPEGMAESLANSDMMSHIGGMVRNNPRMLEQMMRMMAASTTGGDGSTRGPSS